MPTEIETFNRIGAAIVVALLAAWAIRRAGRQLRDALGRRAGPAEPALTKEQVEAITSQGLATAEQLFSMRAKEQQMLATTALLMRTAEQRREPTG